MQIRFLEKDRWAGHVLPMPDDVLTEHYRVESRRTEEGFFVRLCPEKLPAPRVRTPEAYGFPDRLYAPHFRRRALLLETQSCNVGAIAFYLKEGFSLFGFDACCYSNEDIPRGEVRLELGMYL